MIGRARETALAPIQTKRCAVYCRKSSEEGLEYQDFNSLDAQRRSAESYIQSQREKGWVLLDERYDDPGYSGGTMDRPALRRLLADVEAGQIDVIVVYKVDRLSRSLIDFSKIVDHLERCQASFVSVTEHFTTETSMGRLTLNMILSFAQFEREIAGERIRHKVAEAKRLGKHTGGRPVLGYDVVDRKLAVNPAEAALVRRVFERFVRLGSPTRLAKKLNDEGYRTKLWTNRKGERCGGSVWTKAQIYRVLSNRKYVGEVEHRGQVYPGEHEAIVSRKLWDDTRRILAQNRTDRANRTRAKTKALLKGILQCGSCGRSMGPTFTTQRGKRYRYYRCLTASKESHADCPVRSVPAGAIEDAVQQQLRAVFRTPELVAITFRETRAKEQTERERLERRKGEVEGRATELSQALDRLVAAGDSSEAITGRIRDLGRQIDEASGELERITGELEVLRAQTVSEAEVMAALERLDPVWDELFPGEQARIVRLLVARVEVLPDRAEIRIRGDGLRSLASELAEADPGGETEEAGPQ